jgi:DNA-binding response OmpR family regulator
MTKHPVLVIEDEAAICSGLCDLLAFHGHVPTGVPSGEEGLRRALADPYALVLLDVMLPGMSGFDVCRALRARRPEQAILMLTARGAEADVLEGFRCGADDYVTKPFSLRELLARVRAVLRRPGPRQKFEELAFGDVRVHPRGRRVTRAGREVRLTRKEYDLLVYLAAHPGDVVTRERLLDEVWGYERFPTTRTVDTHVLRLRRKLEADPDRPRFIHTVHGQGYRFVRS